jgi:hypothetical protein
LIWLVPETQKKKQSQKKTAPSFNVIKELKSAAVKLTSVDWTKYWDLFVIKLIINFVLNVFQFNINPIMTRRFSTTGKTFGYIIALSTVLGICGHLSMRRLKTVLYKSDSAGFKRLLHGNLLMVYTCLGLGLATTFPIYVLHLLPMTISRVLFDNTFTEVILARASPQEKGSIMGPSRAQAPLEAHSPLTLGTSVGELGQRYVHSTVHCTSNLWHGSHLHSKHQITKSYSFV